MKLAVISDTHLTPDNEPAYSVDTEANLRNILQHIKRGKPDALLITGDICYREGHRETYERFKTLLSNTSFPWYALPGNHDDPGLMSEAFGVDGLLSDSSLFITIDFSAFQLVCLDTSTAELSALQKEALTQVCARGKKTIVAMHHPPLEGGARYVDIKYPLMNRDEVFSQLKHLGIKTLLSGHHHLGKIVKEGELTVYMAPSTWYQIDEFAEEFNVGEYTAGYMMLNIEEGDVISCSYTYLPGETIDSHG